MTRAELQEIFAEIDTSLANFKRVIDASLDDGDLEFAMRRLIALAATLRELDEDESRLQTHH
jgi:hypothetical protein